MFGGVALLDEENIDEAMRHYSSISESLGDGFWKELQDAFADIEDAPGSYHYDQSGLRPDGQWVTNELVSIGSQNGGIPRSLTVTLFLIVMTVPRSSG